MLCAGVHVDARGMHNCAKSYGYWGEWGECEGISIFLSWIIGNVATCNPAYIASPAQAQGVKEVSDYVAQLRRVGKGLGVWEFDKIMAERATTMGQA